MSTSDRFYVTPPVGPPGSGHYCWWDVKDRAIDLTKHGNNITDYIFAGLPNAEHLAKEQARKYNSGEENPPARPRSIGGPCD